MRPLLLALALSLTACGAGAVQTQAQGIAAVEVAHARALDQIDAVRRAALTRAAAQGPDAFRAEVERWRKLAQASDLLRDAEAAYLDTLDADGGINPAGALAHAQDLLADMLALARALGVQL